MRPALHHAILPAVLLAALALATACKPRDTPEPPAPLPQGSSEVTPPAASTADPASAPPPAPMAAAADEPPEGVLRVYVWKCAGGQTLRMKNLFRENAITLEMHEGPRKLPNVVSASGAKFSDGSLTFWTKDRTATLERTGEPPVQCEQDRVESIRADARERGVLIRGTGNEPGWVVEVGPDTRLMWLGDFGNDRREFQATGSSSDPSGTATYTAATDVGQIEVVVQKTPCTDNMSGEPFDHTMTVEIDGRTFQGCAARLE
jgi:uncharacterized membrane protein